MMTFLTSDMVATEFVTGGVVFEGCSIFCSAGRWCAQSQGGFAGTTNARRHEKLHGDEAPWLGLIDGRLRHEWRPVHEAQDGAQCDEVQLLGQ